MGGRIRSRTLLLWTPVCSPGKAPCLPTKGGCKTNINHKKTWTLNNLWTVVECRGVEPPSGNRAHSGGRGAFRNGSAGYMVQKSLRGQGRSRTSDASSNIHQPTNGKGAGPCSVRMAPCLPTKSLSYNMFIIFLCGGAGIGPAQTVTSGAPRISRQRVVQMTFTIVERGGVEPPVTPPGLSYQLTNKNKDKTTFAVGGVCTP